MLVRCLKGLVHYFKVRQVMQEPFEASLSTLVIIAMSDTETTSVPHASLETSNAGDSAQLSAPSSDTSLSNAETLQLFSQLLDAKFDKSSPPSSAISKTKKLPHNRSLRS